MIVSLSSWLLGMAAYRKVIALLLAGCVAGLALGQAAHQQPRTIPATFAAPARTVSVIAGALGTPVIAPPRVVPRPGKGKDGGDHGDQPRDANPFNHTLPGARPLGQPVKKGHPPKGKSPSDTTVTAQDE
jgi:hypothetical protein